MNRWSSRLRRAASLLLGVHLLQVILLAASAVCDLRGATVARELTPVTAAAPAAAHHAHHGHGQHAATATLATAPAAVHTAPQTAPQTPPPSHHAPADATCPMAMACTVTAVVAPVPTFATSEVQVPTLIVPHSETAPLSLRGAPEPPPPRA